MDPIEPISMATPSPFQIQLNALQQAGNTQNTNTLAQPIAAPPAPVLPQNLNQLAGQLQIDAARMAQDTEYFLEQLRLTSYKARNAYNNSRYDEAEGLYKLFFKYFGFYRLFHPTLSEWSEFIPTMFEYAWLKQIQGQRQEATTFINQQLIRVLEAAAKVQQTASQPELKQTIQELQAQSKLPTPNTLSKPVSPDVLINLAAQLSKLPEAIPIARELFGQAAIRSALGVFEAEALAQKLNEPSKKPQVAQPFLLLPFGFQHTGLPFAYFPTVRPDFNIGAPRALSEVGIAMTQLIAPADSLSKDPNPQDQRRRRQRRQQETNKRRNRLKYGQSPPPSVTF